MKQEEKPWPEYPPVLKERAIIQRGLQFYFSCVMCKALGWNKGCISKDACGQYIYKKIAEHCKKWEKEVERVNTAGISRN
jgi:hypothetical protein